MQSALSNIRVIDLSTNAPGPFASTMLADLGAEVTRIVNPAGPPAYAGAEDDPILSARGGPNDAMALGKEAIALDLKTEDDRNRLIALIQASDVLISEMRPGKLEALGLGWEVLSSSNPGLILCEITGYGRHGTMASRAGHDLNYLAASGVLSLFCDDSGRPTPPQNIVADYAAGGSLATTGILAALLERGRTGRGRHLTVSMTDGVRYMASDIAAATLLAGHAQSVWQGTLGGEMPTYGCYRTRDGAWLAVGALEPKFIAELARGLDWPSLTALVAEKRNWPDARERLSERFAAHDLAHWEAVFRHLEACVTPVRTLDSLSPQEWPDLARVLGSEGKDRAP